MVVAAQVAEADGPAVVLESMVAAAVVRLFRDASHDAEDDVQVDGRLHSNSALVAVPTVVHLRTADAAYLLDSEGFAQREVFPLHCHAFRL